MIQGRFIVNMDRHDGLQVNSVLTIYSQLCRLCKPSFNYIAHVLHTSSDKNKNVLVKKTAVKILSQCQILKHMLLAMSAHVLYMMLCNTSLNFPLSWLIDQSSFIIPYMVAFCLSIICNVDVFRNDLLTFL